MQNLNDPKTTEEVGTDDEAFLVIARISIPSNLAWPCDTTCFCKFPAYSATKMFSSEDLELLLSAYKVMHPTINFTPADIQDSEPKIFSSSLSENVVDIVPGQIQRILLTDGRGQQFNQTKTSFLPFPRVFSKFAAAFGNLNNDRVLYLCPITSHFNI